VTCRSGWVIVLYNDGIGHFDQDLILLQTDYPLGLTLWDFDQNGTVDIAVASCEYVGEQYESRVELLWRELNTADWTNEVITPPEPAGASGTQIVAGHVRQPCIPGRLDLVMTNMPDNNIFVLLNDGNRQFNTNPPPGFDPVQDTSNSMGLALGKFRPGGLTTPDDLALSDFDNDLLEVYSVDASANFGLDYPYPLAEDTSPFGVDVGRINVDPKNDIVVALAAEEPCDPGGGIAVFVGYGDGTFRETPYLFCVDPGNNPQPRFVKIADLDQDGFNDIVTSNNNSDNISVLINAFDAIPHGGE
jgi:hypothetical protein